MDIVIDFKKDYSESRVFEDNELIHYPIMDQAMDVFGRLYDNSIKYADNFDLDLPSVHNAISIFGSRGAGKSSFMYSMLEKVKTQFPDAFCLSPVDPSHIEMKQHPFVNVLASIHKAIDDELEKYQKNNTCSLNTERQEYHCLEKPVLRGLKIIDGIGKDNLYEEWNDDDYISLQGVEQALDCNALEKNFHLYVRRALHLIRKKCLVIAFDDIDIDFKKGFEIMEMIRKYLTSPQIIVIITGDQSLYTALVRKYQWQFFDQEYITKEKDYAENHPSEFSAMVDHLENQYMNKVLKPENRITLLTIREYLNLRDVNILVKTENGKVETLMECYKGMLRELGAQSVSLEELAQFMTSLTLRVQVRILTLRKMSLEINESEKARRYLTSGLMSIFSTDIYQKSDNAKELINGRDIYTIEMLRLLVNSGTLFTSCNFMPQTDDPILNKALLAVGIKFDEYLRHDKYLIFDYWARVCYTQMMAEKLGGKTERSTLDDLLAFGRMNTDTGLCKSVGLSEAYFQGQPYPKGSMVMPGCVFVGNSVPSQLSEKNEFLPLIPMQGTVDAKNTVTVFVSIYRLIAVLSEFVYQVNQHKDDLFWDARTALIKLGQYRNYMEPTSGFDYLDGPERVKERPWDYFEGGSDYKQVGKFIDKFKRWAKKDVSVSIQKINRVFTRFYFTIIQIDEQHYSNLGTKFNDIILSLINAAIVEDAIEESVKGININHIGDITQIFINNWTVMHYSKEKPKTMYSLSRWILDCPLLQLFINPVVADLIESGNYSSEYASAILQYDRWLTELEMQKDEMKEIEKDMDKQNKTIDYIDIIEHLRGKKWPLSEESESDNYDQSKKEEVKSSKIINEDINETNKVIELLQSLPLLKDDYTINEQYETLNSDDDDILNEMKNNALVRMFNNTQRKQALEENINELENKIEKVVSFVKEDYNIVKEKRNTFSCYYQYCTIKLNDIE